MAVEADGNPTELGAEVVGNAFVTRFYVTLHESPDLVHMFFTNLSTMSRPGPDGTLKVVNTIMEIDDLILSLDCKDNKAEILTADAQASHMDGVIVLVTGCLTGKDNVRRKFTESFFLAPQDKGYFVLNNAFRFVEADNLPPVESVEGKVSDADASAASSTEVEEIIEVQGDQNTVVEVPVENKPEPNNVAVTEPASTVVEVTAAPTPIASSNNAKPVPEVSSNGQVDAPKKSWASLLKNASEGASSSLVCVPTRAAKPAAPKAAQPSVAAPVVRQSTPDRVPSTSESSVSNGSNMNGTGADAAEDKGHSIYVGDLPFNATVELVEQEFKQFGRIKQGGVQVRVNKGYYFGFVEYEDAGAQQKAVEMRTMIINGKRAFIQEKRTSTRVVNGVSTHPSGRGGGSRGDGFRGQGNYSNGRGYPRNEYKQRNEDAPRRSSSRNGDRNPVGAYQNGGGRGARQAAATPK